MRQARRRRLLLTPEQDVALGALLRDAFQTFPIDELHPELRRQWHVLGAGPSGGARAFLDLLREFGREDQRTRHRKGRSTLEWQAARDQRDLALGKLVDELHRRGVPLHNSRSDGAYEQAARALGASQGVAKRAHDHFRELFLPAFDASGKYVVGKRRKLAGEK